MNIADFPAKHAKPKFMRKVKGNPGNDLTIFKIQKTKKLQKDGKKKNIMP